MILRGMFILYGLLLIGCGSQKQRAQMSARQLEGFYRLGDLPKAWERQRPGGADNAWYNPTLSSTIYSDSNCARRYQDGPLPDLSTHLISGIASGMPVREETLTVDNRAALLRVYSGQLDGVRVQLGIVVLNKDRCTYDLLYLAPPASFEDGWADFVGLISGFETER
ncbi:MAG: hypothetical protein ACI8RZ_006183 [Myxococcota bacterium]|jgi:hypothetical protein